MKNFKIILISFLCGAAFLFLICRITGGCAPCRTPVQNCTNPAPIYRAQFTPLANAQIDPTNIQVQTHWNGLNEKIFVSPKYIFDQIFETSDSVLIAIENMNSHSPNTLILHPNSPYAVVAKNENCRGTTTLIYISKQSFNQHIINLQNYLGTQYMIGIRTGIRNQNEAFCWIESGTFIINNNGRIGPGGGGTGGGTTP